MNRAPFLVLLLTVFCLPWPAAFAATAHQPSYPEEVFHLEEDQWAKFPLPLSLYEDDPDAGFWQKLWKRALKQDGFNLAATIIFLCAIIHTFIVGVFKELEYLHEARHKERIEQTGRRAVDKPHHDARDDVSFFSRLFHFLGEVEAIFGIWVVALGGAVVWFFGFQDHGLDDGFQKGLAQLQFYLGRDVNYTEPLFVIIIMATAATRPIVRFSEHCVHSVARLFGGSPAAWWFTTLTLTPLLGSFITEPAAMTIAAMLLGKKFYDLKPPLRFAYATIGLLFVNISVGGTLTHFAAPPVLMVAERWNWGFLFMMANFGWKASLGIVFANCIYFFSFRHCFRKLESPTPTGSLDVHIPLRWEEREDPIPHWVTVVHLLFLGWTVLTNHYPPLFIGGFLFLIGFTEATGHHQNDVRMRTPLLVGFFLAGLVIHGRCQAWWISLTLSSIDNNWALMIGATILTAFNDNAAVTYLAAQAPGLAAAAKYAVVAGAVTGGGLTVIANAPNPAGQSLLGRYFEGGVSPLNLAISAIIPTLIMAACFMLLVTPGMVKGPPAPDPHHSYPPPQVDTRAPDPAHNAH